MTQRLKALAEVGVSIWLDDMSRERIETGSLADLVKDSSVVGVTTNPTIFATALSDGERYDDQVRRLAKEGKSVDDAIFEITTADVRDACDVLADTFEATGGVDGRVSIEVAPGLAHDEQATVDSAKELWAAVDRPNLFIKIPATTEGAPAISTVLAEGISVNVTLIFGLDRYDSVMDAYLEGLERAKANGHDLSKVHSVASFFVSRVDTEIDKRLEASDDPQAGNMVGLAGIANARLAFKAYEQKFAGERFAALKADGANTQRPLWASTGVKNPAYRDTMYVTDLAVANTVNTMPEKTLRAFADHGEVEGDQVTTQYASAQQVMDDLARLGIGYDDVIEVLEREGVEKFVKSWEDLQETVRNQLEAAGGDAQGSAQ
jgi:transaldolase